MPDITAKLIKELRDNTGAGIMDAKKALEESNGDLEKASKVLAEKGLASAEKRIGRATENGVIESYIHTGGRIGSLVELSCETDFVARTEEFIKCAKEIAMQVAAMNPISINKEDNNEYEDEQILNCKHIYEILQERLVKW